MRHILLVIVLSFGMISFVSASELVLKSGQKLQGKITEQTDQYLKIDSGTGIAVTYYFDEIDTLDGQKMIAAAPVEVVQPSIETPKAVENVPTQEAVQAPEAPKAVENVPMVETIQPPEAVKAAENVPTQEAVQPSEAPKAAENIPMQEAVQPPEVSSQAEIVQPIKKANITVSSPEPVSQKSNSLFSMGLGAGIAGVVLIFIVIFYLIFTYPIYRIAIKLKEQPAWLAWIPLVQLYLICKMAKRPYWVLIVFVLSYAPVVGIVFSILSVGVMVYMWMGVSEQRGKSPWLGLLTIIPIVNIIFIWYLALSD